ncbi:putative betaine--homocysteine S-methyltransferase 1 [Apostichopus japonicus]|uniref:Putative betaine--homocysteine S-methyltransferase 1 n=1 Tax=Stichopus japonicus TaxID=307972 RepID=A0A2G8LCZ3_STIJA|nr:putative betaine--homocysteine S-methyltransferase 1 [Apostichopus japonicus]
MQNAATFDAKFDLKISPEIAIFEGAKKGLLERLKDGVVVGDGSFVVTLERRGYVEAGAWTPEAVVQYPDAVRQLHREFLRAGADVMQTFTFYASDNRLSCLQQNNDEAQEINCTSLNTAACDLAKGVASEGDAIVAGSMSPVPAYVEGKGKEVVVNEFQKQVNVFKEKKVDFLLAEFFAYIEEAEWAIEVMKGFGLPVACTMNIGPAGDRSGVSPGDCAIRMAKAGADVVGINCHYDPFICLDAMKMMKTALDKAGLSCYLMAQPVGCIPMKSETILGDTQHCQNSHSPFLLCDNINLYELNDINAYFNQIYQTAMEPRLLTRVDVARFAREAYNIGVRYIGGCCGFEPYHIRAIAEELATERGKRPPGHDKSGGYKSLRKSILPSQHERSYRDYWDTLVPASGRKEFKHMADVK